VTPSLVATVRTLHSWKEIAARLGVTVRSAQRWERVGALPVHRYGSGKGARVFAYTDELDHWLHARSIRCRQEEALAGPSRKRLLAYIAAAVVFLIVAMGLVLRYTGVIPGARTPADWALEGSKLTVRDARGRLCWEKRFPPLHTWSRPFEQDAVLITDVDGDGRPDVLFNFSPADLGRFSSSLMCFDQVGGLRWEYRYGAPRTFAARSFDASYRGQLVRPVRVGGKARLLTVANHYMRCPSEVSLLDGATGRLLEQYWHPGAIHHLVLQDIDGDGQEEALFGGINNPGAGLGHAALGVLKLPFSEAPRRSAPADDPFPPIAGGGELAYLLFPSPDVMRALAVPPVVTDLRIDRNRRILFETGMPEGARIVYYLDFKLRVQECWLSSSFAPLHERLRVQRLLDHPLSGDEIASLGKPMPFVGAPDGNSPDLTRFWTY